MNKHEIEKEEYLKTALWTFLLAIIIVAIGIIDLGLNIDIKKDNTLHQTELDNKRLEIQKLYYLENKNKDNYMINLKLAVMHEMLKEYNQAMSNYEKAIVKSDNNPFVVFRAAMFLVSQKKYSEAVELANLLPKTESRKIYTYKAKFYSKLAKSFLEDKDYANSIKTYKIAYKYARNSSKELKIKTAKDYAYAYSELADKCINEYEPKLALQALKNALEIYPDPLAKYKIGLIYRNVDDEKSQKYIEEAYLLKPEVVNLELYNDLLNKLIKNANDSKNFSKARFYTLKLEHLKRRINEYHIFNGDLGISDFKLKTRRKFYVGKKETYAIFNLTNNTKTPIENLYIKVEAYPQNSSQYSGESRVATRAYSIAASKTFDNVKIKLHTNDNNQNALSKTADIKIYARKNLRSPWVSVDFLSSILFR